MSGWVITEEEREKFLPIIKEYMDKLESLTEEQIDELYEKNREDELVLDLSNTGINPYMLRKIMEEDFGYEYMGSDQNGWEMDFWINLDRKEGRNFPSGCSSMVIEGCGMIFRLHLFPRGAY